MSFLKRIFNRKENTFPDEEFNKISIGDTQPDAHFTEETQIYDKEERTSQDNMEASQGEYEVVEREILPAKIICPDCGGITLEGLDFCDKCGGELL